MIIILVTLLVISLVIIFIGLLRSSWSHEADQSGASYAAGSRVSRNRSGRLRAAYGDDVYGNRQVRALRTTIEYERRSTSSLSALLDVRTLWTWHAGKQIPWLGMALIMIMAILVIISSRSVLPGSAAVVDKWPDVAVSNTPPPSTTHSTAKPEFPGVIGASNVLVRINQLDPKQYNSSQDYDTWAYSACSAAVMTEIVNAYNTYYRMGRQYRIADILKVEAGLREITPELGLLNSTGIDRTVAQFNFRATWLNNQSIDSLLKLANSGRPIIVGFPPDRWNGGHILVVRGGDSQNVFLADSSRLNMQKMPRATFMKYWVGFAVVLTPKGK